MSQNTKRNLRKTGLSEKKLTSLEQIKAARQGIVNRLDQYTEAIDKDNEEGEDNYGDYLNPLKGADSDDDNFIDRADGFDYDDNVEDEENDLRRRKNNNEGILNLLKSMPNNRQTKSNVPTCDLQLKKLNEQNNVLANAIKGLDDDEDENVDINKINNKYNNNSNSYSRNYNFANYSSNYDTKNFSMNVNQDFLPEKFKNFNLAKNNTNNENGLISNDIKMELENEPYHPVEEVEKKPSKKKEIVSSIDFLEQQRQLKKPESSITTENKKRTTEQMNSNDVLYSTRTPSGKISNSNNNENTPVSRSVPKVNDNYNYNSNSKINEKPDIQFNNYNTRNTSDATLPKSEDGTLLFYWYDAHEETNNSPYIILFGKIYNPETSRYHSLSVIIRNLERKIYLLPKLSKLKNVDSDDNQVLDANKELTFAMFQEFEELRKNKFSYIKRIQTKSVIKKYCFELPIPHKKYPFLKIKFNADYGNLPASINSGENFEHIFHKNRSFLEMFLLSRKIKGPCWLKIKNYQTPGFNITWSQLELNITNYKDIEVAEQNIPTPPFKILSFSTKLINNNGTNEIICISGMLKDNYGVDDDSMAKKDNSYQNFIVMRKADFCTFQSDFTEHVKSHNKHIVICQNETALIKIFISKLESFDPDILIGHNLYNGHLDEIFNRVNKYKIDNWSKFGKLKRDCLPKSVSSGSNFFTRNCTLGRLICDSFLSCRDMLRESNYNLSFLALKYLNKKLDEIDANAINNNIRDPKFFAELGEHTLYETNLTFELVDKLCILQLAKQLTHIAGNLWIKSLQNSRADRCEVLLMHEFNKHKFIIPDKINKSEKFEELINEDDGDKNKKKGPQYSGGLVLEPKAGLYDQIILLLDFNSLYPSIIQEYNICFTTVERKPSQRFEETYFISDKNKKEKPQNEKKNKKNPEENIEKEEIQYEVEIDLSAIKKSGFKSILPSIVESLVKRRKQVKDIMKKETDKVKLSMLEIKQKAFKLSANSLYGYLGYKSSRFYAKQIAALITSTGRGILQDTVNTVMKPGTYPIDVIYGDTDSIMINTNTTDLKRCIEIGNYVKKSINEKYRLLEMEMDFVFKTLLLLKKKKYAALKYNNPFDNNEKTFSEEYKGLDLVRRDWCDLSKETGKFILALILKGQNSKEEVVLMIKDFLKELAAKMDRKEHPVDLYVITKQLTKNLEDYSDSKGLPHIKVAKRMKENGDNTIKNGMTIPYVICVNKKEETHQSKSLADKAFHVKELKENSDLEIDVKWYKENQILASVSRLCKHITEINMSELAEALGIDSRRYLQTISSNQENPAEKIICNFNNSLQLLSKVGLKINCNICTKMNEIKIINDNDQSLKEIMECKFCKAIIHIKSIHNSILHHLKRMLNKYFLSYKRCLKCNSSSRLFLKKNCSDPMCKRAYLRREFSELNVSNEIAFIRKAIQIKKEDQTSNRKMDITATTEFINEFSRRVEFNNIDISSIFSFKLQEN